jgi:hypothetical protein
MESIRSLVRNTEDVANVRVMKRFEGKIKQAADFKAVYFAIVRNKQRMYEQA